MKKTHKRTEERRQQCQYQKRTKSMLLECNSNNNNSTGTDGRRHSVDDEAELVQNDKILKTIVIT
jgi:hypothetical protein